MASREFVGSGSGSGCRGRGLGVGVSCRGAGSGSGCRVGSGFFSLFFPFLLLPHSIGMLIAVGGHVEPCLPGFGWFWFGGTVWIQPTFVAFLVFTCSYQCFLLWGSDLLHRSYLSVSPSLTSWPLFLQVFGLKKLAPLRWRPRGGIKLCPRDAAGGYRRKNTSAPTRIWMLFYFILFFVWVYL